MKNLHITLSNDLVSRLDRVSEICQSSRTALVREAVQAYLTAKERELVAQEMFL
jgi:metal-responsive CopG/Arc/MetJ family transcriptional regulator